jgi:tetratricopeptide (TPR) repeat protein
MDPATIRTANDLFQHAADLPRDERARFLDARCADNTALRLLVDQLLAENDAPTRGPLDSPLIAGQPRDDAPIPTHIGRYEIVRVLGEGGMSVVFEARQQSPSRTVALKVLRPGVLSPELMRRFQHEIQVLGQLQHPGIAHIYEAAVAQSSIAPNIQIPQPYFAMELIRGRSLTAFALANNLSIPDRLELVAKVCDAVQYAHQKGVIHRDLKPPNILVPDRTATTASDTDLSPHPKVLDFGVARMAADPSTATMNTEAGRLIGTLAYMSPEQVGGNVEETDTRSDVYALGVILYEVLSGELPFGVTNVPLHEGVRRIREDQPQRLGAHDPAFRGDIETIAARAMARDKARRYQSAADLAADIRRHLRGEAIEARRDSAVYVLRKFVGRNRAIAASIAALFIGLSLFAAYAYSQARRFESLSRKEHDARVAAESVKDFLDGIFVLATPAPGRGYDLSLVDMLDDATVRLAKGELADDPNVEAEVRDKLAVTYDNLGLMGRAAEHRAWLVEYHRNRHGGKSEALLLSLAALARSYSEAGEFAKANETFTEAIKLCRDIRGKDARYYETICMLGDTFLRDRNIRNALIHGEIAAENLERLTGPDSAETASAYFLLAGVYANMGRTDDMHRAYERCVPAYEKSAPDSPATIRARWHYALDTLATRSPEQAEKYLIETVERSTRTHGADHSETLNARRSLGVLLTRMGRHDEALALLSEALGTARDLRRWVLSTEGFIVQDLARCLHAMGRTEDALRELETTRARLEQYRGQKFSRVINIIAQSADLYEALGKHEQAAAALEDAAARLQALKRPTDDRSPAWLARAQQLRAMQPASAGALSPTATAPTSGTGVTTK